LITDDDFRSWLTVLNEIGFGSFKGIQRKGRKQAKENDKRPHHVTTGRISEAFPDCCGHREIGAPPSVSEA
jgi:hypothetical protein